MSLCAGATIADERAVIVPACKRAGGGAGTVGGVGILVSVLVLLAFKKTKIAATAVTGSEKQIVKINWCDP